MGYQWNAKDYSKNASAQFGWGMELLDTITLNGDEAVLDIGCGDGKITKVIADSVPAGRVIGMDSSEDMIALAQETYQHEKPTLDFTHGDASNLPYRNDFDLVFSNACLHWIKDHRPVLKGIADALRPGGRALLQMGGKGNVQTVQAMVRTVCERDHWKSYFEGFVSPHYFHGDDDYAVWLTEAGLSASRLLLIPKDMVHTPEEFEGWFRSTWPAHIQCVPEPDQPAFIKECMEQYRETNPLQEDGCFHTPVVRLEVYAGLA
jgi:trans-aconitate methyltransferase